MFTSGHRNLHGLAVRPDTGEMWSVEHGPDRDDEINRLVAGGNYGWDPVPGYNESVPMTDFAKFPNAVPAVWSSGSTTFAVSGATFLRGSGWGSWEGALAVSALKDRRLRVLFFDGAGGFAGEVIPAELDRTYGRLRGAETGPGGVLFLTTDNGGGQDQVLAVTPPTEGIGIGVAAAPAPVVDIASRGVDDQIWLRSWDGGGWRDWASLGGVASSDPDASTWGGDRLDVVVRGADSAVWLRARDGGGWSDWINLGGSATGGPAVASARRAASMSSCAASTEHCGRVATPTGSGPTGTRSAVRSPRIPMPSASTPAGSRCSRAGPTMHCGPAASWATCGRTGNGSAAR